MRNIKLQKFAINAVTVLTMLLMVALPLVAGAQFREPGTGGAGGAENPIPTVGTATDLILRIVQILLAIAGLVAVIFLIIGGFRYITAGGNEETSESAKKTITNAIIGIVIIILAFVIVRVIANALIGGSGKV